MTSKRSSLSRGIVYRHKESRPCCKYISNVTVIAFLVALLFSKVALFIGGVTNVTCARHVIDSSCYSRQRTGTWDSKIRLTADLLPFLIAGVTRTQQGLFFAYWYNWSVPFSTYPFLFAVGHIGLCAKILESESMYILALGIICIYSYFKTLLWIEF